MSTPITPVPPSPVPAPLVDLALVRDLALQKAEAESRPILLTELLGKKADELPLHESKLIFIHQGKKLDLSDALMPPESFFQTHTTVDSFCEAIERWSRSEMTVVAIHPSDDRLVAVLDYYRDRRYLNARKEWEREQNKGMLEMVVKAVRNAGENEEHQAEAEAAAASLSRKLDIPANCQSFCQDEEQRREPPMETLVLKLQASEEYAAWVGLNGKEMEQQAFVEFLELHIQDVQGDGQVFAGANQLLKVAMELEARKDVQWASRVNPQTGDRSMVWKETTGAEGGTVVPKRVQLLLRPWVGTNAMHYVAGLSFRASPQGVKFKLTFIGLDRCREAARAMVADQVAEATGYPVFDAVL